MASSSASGSEIKPAPSLLDIMKLPSQSGMQTLDKSAFNVTHPIISLRIDARKVPVIKTHPLIKPFLMDLPKTRPILTDDSDPSVRLLRLRVQSETDLPEVTREYIKQECLGTEPDRIELDYDHWTSSEILNSILPMGEGDDFAPSSFTQTGHIGHVNLREEWLPYKSLIGQVFLDKNPQLRTVVNKLDSIHAEYRYFDMEVIAGEDDLVTTAHEAGCYFTFDFSKVYWNSRLQHEHTRLVSLLQPGQVVADVMAGVGPFAVPAAKKGVFVLGNDLNPESVKWQQENRLKNKVEKTLRVTGLDGKAFIQQSARMAWDHPFPPYTPPSSRKKAEKEARSARQAQKASKDASASTASALDQLSLDKEALEPQLVQHFIMNLPDSALTFLDAFRGCLDPIKGEDGLEEKLSALGLPLVHVYCFTRELDPDAAQKDICERASQSLGYSVTPQIDSYNLHLVRRVAPNKDMYCLTFRLPRAVAFL